MNWLMSEKVGTFIQTRTRTACLTMLLQNNVCAHIFVNERNGFNAIQGWLQKDCRQAENHQIAYNVIAICWVISYHPYAIQKFADYNLSIIELVAKLLDFHNKEKIVCITCMLFKVSSSETNLFCSN